MGYRCVQRQVAIAGEIKPVYINQPIKYKRILIECFPDEEIKPRYVMKSCKLNARSCMDLNVTCTTADYMMYHDLKIIEEPAGQPCVGISDFWACSILILPK